MKIRALITGAVVLVGSALALTRASEAASIAGYLDPANGTFTPAATQAQLARAAATTLTRSGNITVVINVTINSSIPLAQPISCGVSLGSSDFPGISNNASASSNVVRTGGTGKCTMVVSYQWIVANATTMMNVSNINVSTGSFGNGVQRSASTSFPAFPVPNGPKTITVTLAL